MSQGTLENIPGQRASKLWPENQVLCAVDFSGAGPKRMLSTFLSGWKKSKEEEYFTPHEIDMKFKFQCP